MSVSSVASMFDGASRVPPPPRPGRRPGPPVLGAVLVVDGRQAHRARVEQVLRHGGICGMVKHAALAADARHMLALGGVDCVLLSCTLRDADGIRFLAQLRAEGLDLPVVMLTQFCDLDAGVRAMQHGAQDFLPYESIDRELNLRLCLAVERHRIRAQLATLNVRLFAESRRDPLTGLLNRLGLQEALQGLVPSGEPHWAVVLDLDRFKRVNSILGHAGGDAALQQVAGVLGSVRDGELAARVGGDEFVVVARGSEENVRRGVCRLLAGVAGQPLCWCGRRIDLSMTAAMGPLDPARDTLKDVLLRLSPLVIQRKTAGRGGLAQNGPLSSR